MKPIKLYHKDNGHNHDCSPNCTHESHQKEHQHKHECGPDCNHEDHHHDHDDLDLEDFKKDNVRIIPKKTANKITFENFIAFFPLVELPFTITSDTQRRMSLETEPLSAEWLFNFVLDNDEVIDEFTEYMACFAIPNTKDFLAIVYWEANLEGSTFYLTTFSKTGIIIDKAKIAGTKYDKDGLYQMVCTISPTWLFSCAEGRLDAQGNAAPVSSEENHLHTSLQMTGDGEIVPI